MSNAPASPFVVVDRVVDRKGRIGTLEAFRPHTNNSPRWIVVYDDGARFLVWQVDLKLAPVGSGRVS